MLLKIKSVQPVNIYPEERHVSTWCIQMSALLQQTGETVVLALKSSCRSAVNHDVSPPFDHTN